MKAFAHIKDKRMILSRPDSSCMQNVNELEER